MAYVKTNWQTGDIVTADKLNKLEDGVLSGGSAQVLTLTTDEATSITTINASWDDLYNTITSGKAVGIVHTTDGTEFGTLTEFAYCIGVSEMQAEGATVYLAFFYVGSTKTEIVFMGQTADTPMVYFGEN